MSRGTDETEGKESLPPAYAAGLAALGRATLQTLDALEVGQRRVLPGRIESMRERLGPLAQRLATALSEFRNLRVPDGLESFHAELADAAAAGLTAVTLIVEPSSPEQRVPRFLRSMREHCRAQELLYPLRGALPPFARYFVESAFHDRLADLDPEPPDGMSVGLHRARAGSERDGRGGFSLYVPEHLDPGGSAPLVVALHGGFGSGRDFLWTWLREARGRGFLLLAPTSQKNTWALESPALETRRLHSMLKYVCEHWPVDRRQILLTGLSDGATFTLLAGLGPDSPFTALAPVSGVLHPANFANGNLGRAHGRRIYLVHGALDWMFPVELARMARDALDEAGADLTYREIADLSHAYPREENGRILTWFDPALALA